MKKKGLFFLNPLGSIPTLFWPSTCNLTVKRQDWPQRETKDKQFQVAQSCKKSEVYVTFRDKRDKKYWTNYSK